MLKVQCPQCGSVLSVHAGQVVECGHCGAEFTAPNVVVMQQRPSGPSAGAIGCIAVILICAFISIVRVFSDLRPQPNDDEPQQTTATTTADDDKITAMVKAEDVIRQFTKHPLDTKFKWGQQAQKQGPNRWFVAGSFTAKNDLGGTLTHEYRIWFEVTTQGSLDGKPIFTPIDIEIDGESVYHFEAGK